MTSGELSTVAASATVVLTGIGALMRVVFKAVLAVRDNTVATRQLSIKVDAMSGIAGRLDLIDHRLEVLEARS